MSAQDESMLSQELSDELNATWIRFVDSIEPLRPDLYRYCRRMTRSVWDAEDLVQETLLRAFGSMGALYATIHNPRAFLFRTATNLWIDTIRRRETEGRHTEAAGSASPSQPHVGAARDAGVSLFLHLSPQERAAVVLKDVIELSLKEIAEILETTPGAVKSALHRGRTNLEALREGAEEVVTSAARTSESRPFSRTPPSTDLVDRFVQAFNALDLAALTELLLENVSTEVLGTGASQGRDDAMSRDGWVQKSLFGHDPEALDAQQPSRQQRAERVDYEGEPIIAVWMKGEHGENVEWFCRLEEHDGRISRIRDYCTCPETQREVADALALPVRPSGYRLSDQVLAWERA